MRVSFGNLAQQGFLADFSGRERSEQEKSCFGGKVAIGEFFDALKPAFAGSVLLWLRQLSLRRFA